MLWCGRDECCRDGLICMLVRYTEWNVGEVMLEDPLACWWASSLCCRNPLACWWGPFERMMKSTDLCDCSGFFLVCMAWALGAFKHWPKHENYLTHRIKPTEKYSQMKFSVQKCTVLRHRHKRFGAKIGPTLTDGSTRLMFRNVGPKTDFVLQSTYKEN